MLKNYFSFDSMDCRGHAISSASLDTQMFLDCRCNLSQKRSQAMLCRFGVLFFPRNGTTLPTKVYRNVIHTGRKLNFDFSWPPCVHRALTTCQEQHFHNVAGNIKHELAFNGIFHSSLIPFLRGLLWEVGRRRRKNSRHGFNPLY
jgi:hypothetical protein